MCCCDLPQTGCRKHGPRELVFTLAALSELTGPDVSSRVQNHPTFVVVLLLPADAHSRSPAGIFLIPSNNDVIGVPVRKLEPFYIYFFVFVCERCGWPIPKL